MSKPSGASSRATSEADRFSRNADSLSFPTTTLLPHVPSLGDAFELQTINELLKTYLVKMSKQYYQWKVACIMSVDHYRQMYNELMKIDNDYSKTNQK